MAQRMGIIKKRNNLMRVDRKMKNLLNLVNKERVKKGMKRLSARKLTARMANKYLCQGSMVEDEFIKF